GDRVARQGPATRWLLERLLHDGRAWETLDESARQARALLRGAPDRGGCGPFRNDRAAELFGRDVPLRRSHRFGFRRGAGETARLLRTSRNRAGAGETFSRHRRGALLTFEPVFRRGTRLSTAL